MSPHVSSAFLLLDKLTAATTRFESAGQVKLGHIDLEIKGNVHF